MGVLNKHTNPHASGLQHSAPSQQLIHQRAQQQQNQFSNQNNTAMANNAYAQNQAAFQHQQMMMNKWNQARKPKDYRFNGTDMDAEEFANTIFPDDCPEKTFLILKMKGKDNE